MISSDQSSSFFVVKSPSRGGQGRWHLFTDQSGSSLCGKLDWESRNLRPEPKVFDTGGSDSLDEVIGLGEMCQSCAEYVRGQLEDSDLPKPTEGRKKKSNLMKQWKGEEKKSAGEVYGH